MSESQSIDSYKQTITNYSLDYCEHGNQGYKRVLLQLFGLPGNGKSSFINSCKFVIDGVYKEHAMARYTEGGCTKRRIPYNLTNVIWMVDNRGCPTLGKYETGEIFAQLANLLPLNEEVEWWTDYERNVDRLMEENHNPNYTDFIVPIFVHSVKNIIPPDDTGLYKDILKTTRELTGINPIIVLTHKSHHNLTAAQAMFNDMGSDKIYAIENYTDRDHQRALGKYEEILIFLCQILKEVDFCMETRRNPRNERKERLKFILKYIKSADDEKKMRERMGEAEKHRREMERKEEENNRRQREEAEKYWSEMARKEEENRKRETEDAEKHWRELERKEEENRKRGMEDAEKHRRELERKEEENRRRQREEAERHRREMKKAKKCSIQ